MSTDDAGYYGCYCALDYTSGDSGIQIDGNTLPIGEELEWTPDLHVTERGKEIPRVILSRGDKAYGFLPPDVFKQVKPLLEADWTCRAFASAIIFNKPEERYSVEVAVICYAPQHETAFNVFCSLMSKRIAKGDHPAVALSRKELGHVLEGGGNWADTKKSPLPKLPKGTAYFKTKQTVTERAALAAASGNKGCYIGVIAVVVVIIAVVCLLIFR